MRWFDRIRMHYRSLAHRRREVEGLDDELRYHLERQAAENEAAGMPPDEARRAARMALGDAAAVRDDVTDSWSWSSAELLLRDLRIAARTLRRRPGFTVVVALVIALGIGATAALAAVVWGVLLKPLPFRDPARLMSLYEVSSDGKFQHNIVAGGVFAAWRKESHSFSGMAILREWPQYDLSQGGQLPEKVRATVCSWNLFPLLGVQPALGRTFTADDDKSSAPATVILSWALWQRRFGADRGIVGHTISLDGKPYTVIGVMPASFGGEFRLHDRPDQPVQLWLPIYHEYGPDMMDPLDWHVFEVVGRLKPGVSPRQAAAELSVIVRRLHNTHADDPFISKAASIRPLLEDMVGDVKTPLYILLAATACVFLIACLNIGNLLVARAASRRKEIAVRAALGGARFRLWREQLAEGVLLSAAGALLGLGVAYAALRRVVLARPDVARIAAVRLDGVALVVVVALALVCAAVSAVAASLSTRSGELLAPLQESSRSHSAGAAHVRLRRLLLSLEVGLTVVLLVAAGLLLKSYAHLRSTDLGCATSNVLTMRFSLPAARYPDRTKRVPFYDALLESVRALPGVTAAALVSAAPGQGYWGDQGFAVAEHPPLPAGQAQYAINRFADPGYFAALGIPLLRGRTFTPGSQTEAIISAAFARQYFTGEDPIGKHLLTLGGHRSLEVVGVVGDTRYLVSDPPKPTMYFPLATGLADGATLVVRSHADVTTLALPIQRVVQQIDPALAVSDVLTMRQLINDSTIDASFEAALVLTFAVLSLLLAAVGLFGVLSYLVAQRTTEISIRLALGAQPAQMLRRMLLDGMRPAFAGALLGIVAAVGAARLIRSVLYGTQPLDPGVFGAVLGLLLLVAAVACLLPAWRASRVDPMVALREQ